jgi:hypothetical protein
MNATAKRLQREHNDRMLQAWWIAALPRHKKMPSAKKLMIRDHISQSAEQMAAVARQWTLLLGGKIEGKPN